MNKESSHISTDRLQTYLDQELDQTGLQEVELHLNQCPSCQAELTRLEGVFTRLERLPALKLDRDISSSVLAKLREESKLSVGITWTLALEALGAGTVIGLLIPAFRAASWIPQMVNAQTEIQAGINIFLAQLASNWLVWWVGLQLNIQQTMEVYGLMLLHQHRLQLELIIGQFLIPHQQNASYV